METQLSSTLTRGGEFIIKDTDPQAVFIPEEWTEEQLAIAKMVHDFLESEILPDLDNLDKMTPPDLMEQKLTKAGELGLLGLAIPEAFGGFGLDFKTNVLAAEILGMAHSFSVAILAHTGIGSLPILYFGTEAQKTKYLPDLASGARKACYCLTEPGSGSDALGARTKAVLNDEGTHYVLNGQKMWITNAGFADVFTVFAKVDGELFTAFIVEKGTQGLTLGEEEHKMGIKGSSTRQVFFSDASIPKENLLGQIGKGHLIAFNILNIGRIKLAAAVLGGSKEVATLSVKYANERRQFDRPISSFGAIQHKLAEQAIRIFVLESALYRASDDIQKKEQQLLTAGKSYGEALLGAAQEYAAECAILKVLGSEVLDYVVDEGVQIYGGYGFSAEFPMERAYRDARINRIFEGTNEINRMLTVDYVLKKALKGELNLMGPAMAVQKELMSVPDFGPDGDGSWLSTEYKWIQNLKKAILMTAGAAAQKYLMKIEDEQEMLMGIADMMMYVYAAESTWLRLKKLEATQGQDKLKLQHLMLQVYLQEVVEWVHHAGADIIYAMAEGDEQRVMLLGLKRFTKTAPFNSISARRAIAAELIERNCYCY